jgi:hypothetical protein
VAHALIVSNAQAVTVWASILSFLKTNAYNFAHGVTMSILTAPVNLAKHHVLLAAVPIKVNAIHAYIKVRYSMSKEVSVSTNVIKGLQA